MTVHVEEPSLATSDAKAGANGTSPHPRKERLHTRRTRDEWEKIERLKKEGMVLLDGNNLDIASVVAVARCDCDAYVDAKKSLVDAMDGSVKLLDDYLSKGYFVYGVNTGFGGSADSRTGDLEGLQRALLQHTQSGVLTEADTTSLAANQDLGFHSMPVSWVRATMLIRCNSALRGHSGIRLKLLEAILALLRKGLTPVIPLRGSISASGDLMPLSYVAGLLEGNPDILVRTSEGSQPRIMTAKEALEAANIEPVVLGPKEGLVLINGTAASAGVGCLASHDAGQLALLSQVLTAMSCEALAGKLENFHPFIAAARPHAGQAECAGNMYSFLLDSSLVEKLDDASRFKKGLFQDRYALRTAPQWLGPQLEDLSAIMSQLTVELNSTSDNPLVDVEAGEVYSGGNFQAASMASAMEKSRLCLQMTGKLLFSLSTELINPSLNKGLPPNLCADDPSLSFTMKGVDVNMAAYMSELAFLTNPVTSHVQAAEMQNQPVNSLALISARYTMQAAEIVALMCASLLYVACQALDLRVLHNLFLKRVMVDIQQAVETCFAHVVPAEHRQSINAALDGKIATSWTASTPFDLEQRCQLLSEAVMSLVVDHLARHALPLPTESVRALQTTVSESSRSTFQHVRDEFFLKPATPAFLGTASGRMYSFVRDHLAVPMHRGLVEHPRPTQEARIDGRPKKTIGSWISTIYAAIRDGTISRPLADIVDGLH